MRVSVVVPVYNGGETIAECLQALKNQAYRDFETVVVDDASTDDSAAIARRFPVKLLSLAKNTGAAGARNQGARIAAGDIIVFTDSDCVAPRDWLQKIVDHFNRHQDFVSVTGIYTTRNRWSLVSRFIGHETRFRMLRESSSAALFGTYNSAIRRSAFFELNGFDEGFTSVGEDADFGFRLGYRYPRRMRIRLDLEVGHYHRTDLFAYLKRQFNLARARGWIYGSKQRADAYAPAFLLAQLPLPAFMLAAPLLLLLQAGHLGLLIFLEAVLAAAFVLCNAGFIFFIVQEEKKIGPLPLLALGIQWLRQLCLTFGLAVGLSDKLKGRSPLYRASKAAPSASKSLSLS